jgi:hypothetical protein
VKYDGHRAGTGIAAVLAIAAIATGCSTTASDSRSSDDASYLASAEAEDSEKLICRREQPTGSRISERICLTAADWDKIERQSQEMLDRTTRKAQQYEDQ